MLKKAIIVTAWMLLFWPCLLWAQDQAALKIAALPCEVFSMQESADLGREVAAKLSKRLAINPAIVVAGMGDVLSVVREDEYADLNEERLKEIARLLSANFVLFGSVTKIRSEISMDVQVYSSFDGSAYFKTFAEGVDLEIVLEKVASRVEQELLSRAALIPPSQRPRAEKARRPAPKHKRAPFDLDSELAEALGEPEEVLERTAEAALPPAEIMPGKPSRADLQEKDKDAGTGPEAPEEEALTEDEVTTEADGGAEAVEEPASEPAGSQTISAAGTPASPKEAPKRGKKGSGQDLFQSDTPINISSDSMEYDNKKSMALFIGNVVARQEGFVIFADKMRVFYSESGGLKQVRAAGQVKIIQGDRIATGKQIVFYNDRQKIVATGNPRVWQGDNVVYGKKITIFLKEDRSIVEGGPESRASATIYPKKKKSKSD